MALADPPPARHLLSGTNYGSSSLCTVSSPARKEWLQSMLLPCQHLFMVAVPCAHRPGSSSPPPSSLLPGILQYTYAVAGISLAVSALVSLIQVGEAQGHDPVPYALLPPAARASCPAAHRALPSAPAQCCTCNMCGLGKAFDVILAAFGTAW